MPHRFALSLTLACAILISSCSDRKQSVAADLDLATATYGYGVEPDPAVTYQPDVIIVGGGPRSVRSVSADGLTWVFDGNAPRARDLQPGKVLFATSRAAGRIMSTQAVGNDIAVTLGPVQLGDILRDADLKIDVKLNPEQMYYQSVPAMQDMYRDYAAPDAPPATSTPIARVQPEIEQLDAHTLLVRLSPIQIVMADALGTDRPTDALPMTTKSAPKISINGWEIEPSFKRSTPSSAADAKVKDRLGLKIQRKLGESTTASGGKQGLKAGFEVGLWARDLTFKARTVYKNGKLDRDSMTVVVDGLEGFDVDILSGIEQAGDNMKVRLEVPIEWIWPLPPAATYGVPLVIQTKIKFLIETVLGGANATLKATGNYDLQGPLGIENGKIIVPEAQPSKPVATSEDSVSLGVSGLVFTTEYRFLAGVGPPALFAGPYAKITAAVGLTKSADVSIMMARRCSGTTVKIDGGSGIGFQLKVTELGALQKLLGEEVKADWEVFDSVSTFYKHDSFVPDIPACHY